MSSKLFELLFPTLSETMTEEAKTLFFAVLRTLFEVRHDEEKGTQIVWLETLPGRYRQAGRVAQGTTVTVLGQTLNRKQVIWMLLSGHPVMPGDMLQTEKAWPGDKLKPKDARTWRLYKADTKDRRAKLQSIVAYQNLPFISADGTAHARLAAKTT